MGNKCIFALVLLFSSVALSAEAKVVGLVFHGSYCQDIPAALESYLEAVRNKGYDVVELCAATGPDTELKADIEAEAKEKNIEWADIEGITIIGPVINTFLSPSLSRGGSGLLPSVAGLVFDDFSFFYRNVYLTDVKSGYLMPGRVRWVSQLFLEETPSERVVEALSVAETQLASPNEVSCGQRFSNELLSGLDEMRVRMTDSWNSYPQGLGWNLMAPVFTVAIWYITGASREAEGYSKINRLQTPTDKFMYRYVIIPGLLFINSCSAYYLWGHLFGQPLPDNRSDWKRYALNKRLRVDGLAKLDFCGKE